MRMVRKWSWRVNPLNVNYLKFHKIPVVYTNNTTHLDLWTKAYNWRTSTTLYQLEDNNIFYSKATANQVSIDNAYVSNYEELSKSHNYKDFNHFVTSSLGLWRIFIDPITVSNSNCTCPMFYKRYICKHFLGTLIRFKLLICPDKAKDVPIGYIRSVGRPKQAKKALMYQPDFFKEIMVDSEEESVEKRE